jgi:hypothetical protein
MTTDVGSAASPQASRQVQNQHAEILPRADGSLPGQGLFITPEPDKSQRYLPNNRRAALYDGSLFPEWRGDLLVPALKERAVRRVLRDGRRIVGQQLLLADLNERMRDVKVAPDGLIYILTDGIDAKLLRLTPPSRIS